MVQIQETYTLTVDPADYFNDVFDWIKNSKDHNHFLIKLGITTV